MLDETRNTDRDGMSVPPGSQKTEGLGGYDRELIGLIDRTAQRDEAALATLYDKTGSQVYGLAFRVLNDSTMAEEVTMDVFMQVWRQAAQFDQGRGHPMVWLTMLTRSRAIDRLRVGKKEPEAREPLDEVSGDKGIESDPEQSSVYLQQRRIIRQALTSLPSEQREIIELAYFGGLSHSEISIRIGEPLGTVKTRIRLGMVKLRNQLGPLEEGLIP
ncbi:MAG: sigma-70 family RNA polymerase sigma factor [Nitrospirales bacterium]